MCSIPSSAPVPANSMVTQEEFCTFHNIDRRLYARLVLNFDREPGESMQVMALLLWLEQTSQAKNLVAYLLLLPDALINAVADEAVVCLNSLESEHSSSYFTSDGDNNVNHDIPLIQSLTKHGLCLKFFQGHSHSVIQGVIRNVKEVCVRAFDDILRRALREKRAVSEESMDQTMKQQLSPYGPVMIDPVSPAHYHYYHNTGGIHGGNTGSSWSFINGGNSGCDPVIKNQLSTDETLKQVSPDDRTVFLTFSKGYPISENEVRDFFNRRFGNCIEALYMQEVSAEEQPLFARLVLHSPSTIEVVLEGKSKAKFSINGKHVWGRKFVRRNPNPKSPLQASCSYQLHPCHPHN